MNHLKLNPKYIKMMFLGLIIIACVAVIASIITMRGGQNNTQPSQIIASFSEVNNEKKERS